MHSHLIFWKYKTADYIFTQVELGFPSFQALRETASQELRENSVETMQKTTCFLKGFRGGHVQEHVCHVFLQNCPFPQKAPKDLALLKPYPVQSCVHFVYQSWYIFILKEKNKQVTSEKESIFFSESGGRKGLVSVECYSPSRKRRGKFWDNSNNTFSNM